MEAELQSLGEVDVGCAAWGGISHDLVPSEVYKKQYSLLAPSLLLGKDVRLMT